MADQPTDLDMATYKLRFFFSPGSGICLWSANDATREKWDYPVDVQALPLPENTWRKALYVMAWHDTSIDWSHPSGPSPWTDEERFNFNRAAQSLLALLREQLGSDFEICDESETKEQQPKRTPFVR